MLRIGFICPSSDYLFDPFRGDPHTHFQILTVLEARFGGNVDLRLIDLRGIERKFAEYHIPECDVYLYSLYTLDHEELTSLTRILRARYPRAKHITGGPHATVYQEECLKIFDSLIIGEGEESIVRAISDYMSPSGLKPIYTEPKPVDINRYPVPSRKYLPSSSIAREGLMAIKTKPDYDKFLSTTVMFSRGCPYKCSYCAMTSRKAISPTIRYRTPELIEEEIEYLKHEYQIQGINMFDEIGIPMSQKAAIPHLEAFARTGILWRGQIRVDGISPEIASLAKESGCIQLSLGVESVCQQSLDIVNKKIKVSEAKNTIRLLKENGIECRVYLISGMPGEPEDIVQQTLDFLEETQPDSAVLSLFTVRPGTEAFEHPERFGIKKVRTDWRSTMHLQGRYEEETPALTMEYEERTPWGRGFSTERIISNFRELHSEINARGFGAVVYKKSDRSAA
ncbi:MAG: B12-binding domain-containing radical SAM protein [Candidatus Omnitrophota bacterium]|nr:B12-binding domain-containing radical SAM protein [Candidatus Omnitrophota bacterium]